MLDPTADSWKQVRAELQRGVPQSAWELWLSRLTPREISPDLVVLAAPDQAARWIAGRFGRVLQTSAAAVLGPQVEVDVVGHSTPPRSPSTHAGAVPSPGASLNPDYTFDHFVIGEGNRLAHAAALAVAENPGHAYNPLFLCGPPGVGKTHLLHSVAAYARAHAASSVRCVTADSFTSEYVQAVRGKALDHFKAAYRTTDVLLVDDVQFLQDKTRTEEEFFHTFNALYEIGAQLVLTSDRLPHDIAALEERLRERFAAGLVAELAAPDFDTRVTILRRSIRREGLRPVADDVLEAVAARVTGNVRTLLGALTTVIARSSLYGQAIDGPLVASALASGRSDPTLHTSVADVQAVVCRTFGLTLEELVSSSRAARLAWPRQLAMYIARQHVGATFPAIGREFGGRNHSTVVYAWRHAAGRLAQDSETRRQVEKLWTAVREQAHDRGG